MSKQTEARDLRVRLRKLEQERDILIRELDALRKGSQP